MGNFIILYKKKSQINRFNFISWYIIIINDMIDYDRYMIDFMIDLYYFILRFECVYIYCNSW